MRLEFHQLERHGEHLRVWRPERQRRLLASLATAGQQAPIIVVALADLVPQKVAAVGRLSPPTLPSYMPPTLCPIPKRRSGIDYTEIGTSEMPRPRSRKTRVNRS